MRTTAVALFTFALGGCNSLLGITDITVGSGDGGTSICFNAAPASGALFAGCTASAPTGQFTVENNIDTDTEPACAKVNQTADAPVACVIAADSISVPTGHHYVSGNNVLVLLAGTTIDVQGTLDASGSATTTPVVGSVCNNVSSGADDGTTGGGGGGGAFGDVSGTGGAGGTTFAEGGAGASAITSIIVVRAGCAGEQGGTALPATTTSVGGVPGGAIYMVAGKSITVEASGVVLANGGGGGGAAANEGGGGGASGGLLGFDSAVVEIDGTVTADGGGGGGGGGANGGDNGGTSQGVLHGTGSTPGGNGGDGGADFTVAGDGIAATGNGGGGGAGGSVGVVYIHSPEANLSNATIDPPAVQN